MPAKRNPFNENVNRLMEKIFLDKKPSHTPQRSYQDEMLPERNGGILHGTQTKKKKSGDGKGKEADEYHFLDSSLQNIRRATEKMRETTKQMQQMTLRMWEETVQVQQKGSRKDKYEAERIPPRAAFLEKNGTGADRQMAQQAKGKSQPKPWTQPLPPLPPVPTLPSAPPVPPVPHGQRFLSPQYRVEEVLDDSVPERIRECRQMARSPQGYRMTKEELFFRQAQQMEDYEDDCLYPGDFTWYFPTYQAMNAAQLRGYFTWRTQVRQGNISPAPLSFAFVYVYELLHQIGADTPEKGFSLLKTFWEGYREYDIQLDRYLQNWLCDYVVYYNLDRELLLQSQDVMFDEAMLAFLTSPQEGRDEEYFTAICALSRYNMEGSKFYKEYPEDVRRVTCGVFRALTAYYEKHGKKTLVEKYFGTLTTCAYQMFASAVFYDHKKYAEYEYTINPLHRYRCVNGRWSCEKYFGSRTKNKEMGFILHAIDARMRERYTYKSPLKPEGMTKLVMNIIEKEIDRLLEEKKKNAAPVIEIDVTKLSGIRRAAELTRERLIVEGSEEDAEADFVTPDETENPQGMDAETRHTPDAGDLERPAVPPPSVTILQEGTGEKQNADTGQLEFAWEDHSGVQKPTLLNEVESTLLRFLLDGTPYQEFLHERRQMLSVVVDAINEKLFDRFGDTVIVFEGDTPEVLEDYAEEAAEILSEG